MPLTRLWACGVGGYITISVPQRIWHLLGRKIAMGGCLNQLSSNATLAPSPGATWYYLTEGEPFVSRSFLVRFGRFIHQTRVKFGAESDSGVGFGIRCIFILVFSE